MTLRLQSYHSRLFREVDADGAEAIDGQRDEHDQDLDGGHPVGEVGPVISGVAAQLPFPVRFWGPVFGATPSG